MDDLGQCCGWQPSDLRGAECLESGECWWRRHAALRAAFTHRALTSPLRPLDDRCEEWVGQRSGRGWIHFDCEGTP